MAVKEHLPAETRQGLGRVKRALLDQPEPRPKTRKKAKPKRGSVFASSAAGCADGYDTQNVDHLSREGMIDEYKAPASYSPDVIRHPTPLIDVLNECQRLPRSAAPSMPRSSRVPCTRSAR